MLEVFKSLPTARLVLRQAELAGHGASLADYARDTITLGWEDRLRSRGRRRTDAGIEFGTALARGTVLREGDGLVVDALRLIAMVSERPEPVLIITPTTSTQWGLFGYHLGNSHQPIMLTDSGIVCLDDLGTRQVLRQHAIPFERDTRPFTPIGLVADHRHADGALSDRVVETGPPPMPAPGERR